MGEVVRLDDYRNNNTRERQDSIRRVAEYIANQTEATAYVAGIAIGVSPSGEIHAIVRNVEPEHVEPLMETIAGLSIELAAFASR